MRFLLFIAFVLPFPTLAAFEIERSPGDGGISRITVLLSATTTSINAVEGTLVLPGGVHAAKLYTGSSVIGSWVEAPRIKDGSIRFAGIIPGGFKGSANAGRGLSSPAELFSFELGGSGPIILTDGYEYLNDGEGTRVTLSGGVLPETLTAGGALQEDDRKPPEYVEAVRSRIVLEGRKVLLLDAFDAASGIDRFEVQEGDGPFEITGGVYEIKDSTGLKALSIRAYDRAGNFIEMRVEGEYAIYLKLIAGLVILVALIAAWVRLVYLRKRRTS